MPQTEIGRNRTSERSVTGCTRHNRSALQKGVTPWKIVAVDTSAMTPLGTKTFRSTGAVVRPISMTTTMARNPTG